MQPGRKISDAKQKMMTDFFFTSQFLLCPEVELGVAVSPHPLADQTLPAHIHGGGSAQAPSGWLCGLRRSQGFAASPTLDCLCCPGAWTG